MKLPKYLKTKVVVFKCDRPNIDLPIENFWAVTLEGLYSGNQDDHVDLAEFKTRQEAREYAKVVKVFFEDIQKWDYLLKNVLV
jgi:hypothetical protein